MKVSIKAKKCIYCLKPITGVMNCCYPCLKAVYFYKPPYDYRTFWKDFINDEVNDFIKYQHKITDNLKNPGCMWYSHFFSGVFRNYFQEVNETNAFFDVDKYFHMYERPNRWRHE